MLIVAHRAKPRASPVTLAVSRAYAAAYLEIATQITVPILTF